MNEKIQIEIPLKRNGQSTDARPVGFAREKSNGRIRRTVRLAGGGRHSTTINVADGIEDTHEARSAYDLSWLRSKRKRSDPRNPRRTLRMADLFCGVGGLTLGALEAGRAVGFKIDPIFAADTDPSVREGYEQNFAPTHFEDEKLEKVLTGKLGSEPTVHEAELTSRLGPIDLLVGGPPCQGHSNLNNHTRRNDPKNILYEKMARFTDLFRPEHVIIENVHGALHDRGEVVKRTSAHLSKIGYKVDIDILHGQFIGLPQTRHRVFLVASKGGVQPKISYWEDLHRVDELRTFDWACEGLPEHGEGAIDRVTVSTAETQRRIDYLFDNGLYDLPNSERPDCHRTKKHTYVSVYGRIHPDQPAPTMTTGFTVMGQGRFVHPHFRRTLTPREGARLQGFPDWFSFGPNLETLSRRELVSLIGNAVPPKMAYVLLLELFRR